MKNQEIAALFSEIADLLEVKGESRFRVNAYRRGARAIESLAEPVEEVHARGALTEIPAIGESLAEKIAEYLERGEMTFAKDLERELPAGLVRLMTVPEVGPKTAAVLYHELGITSIDQLEQAARAGRIRDLPRMGPKTEENILRSIEELRRRTTRAPIGTALPEAQEVVERLRRLRRVKQVSLAGSIRRMKETVGDIDIVATSTDPDAVMEAFVESPAVAGVVARGPTKTSVLLTSRVQADLRVVEPESYGAALQYFTGSKEHNIRLRERAVRLGIKLNEYGAFRVKDDRRLAGESEEGVYKALGLPWIPPELREDWGEIEAAERRRLPRLVTLKDIRGDLHMHTAWSDGSDSAEAMATAGRAAGYEYVCITDHSASLRIAGGVPVEDLRAHVAEVRRLSERLDGIEVLIGSEVDILPDGGLDYPDAVLAELDVVIGAVHSRFRMSGREMTRRIVQAIEHPRLHILGHPTGRLIGARDPYEVDVDAVIDAAARTGTVLELNATPERLDLKDVYLRAAGERGVTVHIGTDAHSRHQLRYMEFGVGMARRGWLEPKDVLNTRPLRAVRERLRAKAG